MLAGLAHCRGDYVTLLDVDLQDPPELLPQMFEMLGNGEGYACVATRRVSRAGEPKLRSWFAKLFYKLINRISFNWFALYVGILGITVVVLQLSGVSFLPAFPFFS